MPGSVLEFAGFRGEEVILLIILKLNFVGSSVPELVFSAFRSSDPSVFSSYREEPPARISDPDVMIIWESFADVGILIVLSKIVLPLQRWR